MTRTFTSPRLHHVAPSPVPCRLTAVVLALSAWQPHAHAADSSAAAPAAPGETQQIQVVGRHYDNAVGTSDAASEGVIRAELIKARPALRPGEVLEFVPGLIVTQHSGDGKANQYFLRGFNLDHGTDFATSVEGMPVNMPSHAHGQGYSDLNFMIPELVDHIDYRKGPYFASHGDFASAGSADIAYKTSLAPLAQLTLGQHAYRRGLFAGSTTVNGTDTLLGAVELMGNDGPWTVPENLQRHNAVLKYSHGTLDEGFTLEGMAYQAQWTSTDQVPQRLIDAGSYNGHPFGRFDSLDPTDGGNTARYSLSGEWHRRGADDETQVSACLMSYRLALWSNFTYAMERPDTGDQFSQRDKRTVSGLKVSQAWSHTLGGLEARTELGLQLRHDNARVGLFNTEARKTLSTTRDDDVHETLVGIYAQNQLTWTPWLRSLVGLRADKGYFSVDSLKGDAAAAANTGSAQASKLSPKLALVLGPWAQTEFFVDAGKGFHSNDARGTTTHMDPSTGEAVDPVPGLVSSRGWELGLRTEAVPGLQSSLAWWHLKFGSELVYVGDAGATEASGATTRKGIEWNNRWTPGRHLAVDADFAWTHARFDNGDRIPNSVDQVASVGLSLQDLGPWSGGLQWRYLGSGPLIEDNSVRSKPASTFNLRVARELEDLVGHPMTLSVDVFNLTNRKVDDIQYYYSSQLPGEASPVDDRIVHPAEPRTVRVTLQVRM